jgi:hypothetical protein
VVDEVEHDRPRLFRQRLVTPSGSGRVRSSRGGDRLRPCSRTRRKELEPHRGPELDLIFLDDMTVEVPDGWIFFWDDRRHAETGAMEYALARYRSTGSMRETWRS